MNGGAACVAQTGLTAASTPILASFGLLPVLRADEQILEIQRGPSAPRDAWLG